jgi:hypothetical protein
MYVAGLNPDGTAVEHAPFPVCGGVGGLRPFSVAPFCIHVWSVKYASELTSMTAPPACSTSSGRNWLSYWTWSLFGSLGFGVDGATALISSSGSLYAPNGASRSRRFWTFSKLVTSKLPAANEYGSSVFT